ncbi:hypothetical protein B0H13DRAFT_1916901 [Mycena leptocephala]|nr:hypothetical protein B0H13DRAFT_1916901 [Mycena leptocephala]
MPFSFLRPRDDALLGLGPRLARIASQSASASSVLSLNHAPAQLAHKQRHHRYRYPPTQPNPSAAATLAEVEAEYEYGSILPARGLSNCQACAGASSSCQRLAHASEAGTEAMRERKSGGPGRLRWERAARAAIPTAPAKKQDTEHGYQERGNAHGGGVFDARSEKKMEGEGKERALGLVDSASGVWVRGPIDMLNIIIKNKSQIRVERKNADTSLQYSVFRSLIWARDGGRGRLDERGRDMEVKEREGTGRNAPKSRESDDDSPNPSQKGIIHVGRLAHISRRVLHFTSGHTSVGTEESWVSQYTSPNGTQDGGRDSGGRTSCSMVVKIPAMTVIQQKKAEREA